MPDGRVQRIDHDRGVAYVVRRGRTYQAPLDELEPKARIPSAIVRFDLVRHGGSESAENVRLRGGTRTNRRHRRFGDLTGARRPGAKVETIGHRSFGVDVTTQPFRVARAWLGAIGDQDFDGATSLYLPGASVHTAAGQVTGRRRIRAELERSPLIHADSPAAEIRGVDRYIRIDCRAGADQHTVYLVVERGLISEQWIDLAPVIPELDTEVAAVEMVTRGEVPVSAQDYATGKLQQLMEQAGRPVHYARLKLVRAANPADQLPTMVEATIEFNKNLLRAHSRGTTFAEAADLALDRLSRRIEHTRTGRKARSDDKTVPGTWRHGDEARPEKPYFERPEDEREVVRHKSFTSDEMTVDEAAWDMTALDYDFYLFVELLTGQDSLLEAGEDGSWLLRQLVPGADDLGPAANHVTRSATPPPEFDVSEAIDLLNATDDRLLFFKNRTTGRGNIVYRRYDGHYGLVTPRPDESDTDQPNGNESNGKESNAGETNLDESPAR